MGDQIPAAVNNGNVHRLTYLLSFFLSSRDYFSGIRKGNHALHNIARLVFFRACPLGLANRPSVVEVFLIHVTPQLSDSAYVDSRDRRAGPSARGQAGTAEIIGTVTDSTGAVLPNVLLTLTNLGTMRSRELTTGIGGAYVAPSLPSGSIR